MSKKMNPQAKTQIVEALRSGKYKQGAAALRENDCFCIWGVICDVSGLAGWQDAKDHPTLKEYGTEGNIASAPSFVREWIGLSHPETKVVIGGVEMSIMGHNDTGKTFEQMADAIEAQL